MGIAMSGTSVDQKGEYRIVIMTHKTHKRKLLIPLFPIFMFYKLL